MTMYITWLLVLSSLIGASLQRSSPQDASYVAAVLEYNFSRSASINLQNYVSYIEAAAAQGADIVVFPELTLNRLGPVEVPVQGLLLQYPVPALMPSLYNENLVNISAAALANDIYVVINVEERLNCSRTQQEPCPEEKEYLFNTNVVFDRQGAVIDRYRKINLFGEFTRTPALQPDLGIFSTDFGVTFGHFICFDLMFQVPAIQVVEKHKITDVIFSTMWFSELPFLTAVQIQEAYAYTMDVNMLASGANNVAVGSAGSGIYSGKAGALVSTMPGSAISRLLVSTVPKTPGNVTAIAAPGPIYDDPADTDTLFLIQDPSLPAHVSRKLDVGFQEFSLTHNEVTCKFRLRMTRRGGDEQYEYFAAAFDGTRSFSGRATGGTRTCSVVACTHSDFSTCGLRFSRYTANTTAIFSELQVEARVPAPAWNQTLEAHDSFYAGLSVDVTTMPLEPSQYTYQVVEDDGDVVVTMELLETSAELYNFGVWGRVFATDGQEPTGPQPQLVPEPEAAPQPGSAAGHTLSVVAMLCVLVAFM